MSIDAVILSATAVKQCDRISADMDIPFGVWLANMMEARDLSQAEMARLSGLSRQAISDYVNLKRSNPDTNALSAIARGLKLSVETVYRAAGLLPAAEDDNVRREELLYLFRQLTPVDQDALLDFARYKNDTRRSVSIYEIFEELSRQTPEGILILVAKPDDLTRTIDTRRYNLVTRAYIEGQGYIVEATVREDSKSGDHTP